MKTYLPKHRADIAPHDVLALDMLAERLNHRPNPRHARRKHVSSMPVDRWPSMATCTGGLVTEMGKRLTKCRSWSCPRHSPEGYAEAMARHCADSVTEIVRSVYR